MSYYLSKNDVKVLKQTINTVNNISTGIGQGKRPTIKNAFAYAELTDEDANGLWSAKEVYFDETGTPIELSDGRTWGGDNPSIIVNGTVSTGQVMRVESYYLVDSSGEQLPVRVGSAVGGGSSDFSLQMSESVGLEKNVPAPNGADVVTDLGVVIESGVTVIQRVFDTARIYDEILYGYIDEEGYYCIDKSILGV